jgi:hypothetical protein
MPQAWSDDAIRHLLDSTSCPRCGVDALQERRCLNCGADLRGMIADQLWAASAAAVQALRARQQVLDEVPTARVTADRAATPVALKVDSAAGTITAPAEPRAEGSSATVQSVLAVAGAGLFAVAAIVFTFFNPDLKDDLLRSLIVGGVTLVFLAGAWLLARRKLQFSAEAVGALGMVFVALDVYAVSELAQPPVSVWVFTAIGTLVSAIVMIVFAAVARIRTWLLLALVGLAVVPAMFGYAGGTVWSYVIGHLGTAFAALVLHEGVRRLAPRFDGKLTADRVTMTLLQIVAIVIALIGLPLTDAAHPTEHWLAIAGVLAAVAMVAAFATRHLIVPFWSFVVGAFATAAVVVLPFALDLEQPEWYLALVPAAAAVVLIIVTAVRRTASVERPPLIGGVVTVGVIATSTTVLLALVAVIVTMTGSTPSSRFETVGLFGRETGLAIVLGLVAAVIGLAVVAVLSSRRAGTSGIPSRVATSAAVSLLMLAVLAFASWSEFLPVTRISIAIGAAVVSALVILLVPAVRKATLASRVPSIVGAHFALVFGGVLSWAHSDFTIWTGVALVAALVPVALTVPAVIRPVHVGVGYAYALVIFARALDLADLEQLPTIAVLCLTTTLASVGAIVATLLHRIRAASWYAVLLVTSVPFLIGIVVTLFERSGWTALSTGVTFALALTLLLTRRPGLHVVIRAVAAGLLVPALAVVVLSLIAEFLESSGSPIALPIIAVLVAGVLPSTGPIRSWLLRHGLPERDASLARLWIEGSALLTGAIAVVLALVRAAAGFDTTFLVLLIIGIGAMAAAIWGKRRYSWWVAFACFTGALWCQWALAHITVVEPYLLPPALALAIIGTIVTGRGGRGAGLYATGLAIATVPVLAILAVAGNGDDGTAGATPWRAAGLLAGAWILLPLGALAGRGKGQLAERFATLRLPTLAVAIVAGAAGPLQAMRYAFGIDSLDVVGWPLLLVCLALGVAGAIAAAAAARVAVDSAAPGSRLARTRWLYVPATVYLAVSAWPAMQQNLDDWGTIWTMWGLMLAYLLFMVLIVLRARRRATTLPPVWLVFAIAFITSIVAWSPRELHVEWYSIPLGVFLLGAGVLAMRGVAEDAIPAVPTANSWPIGHRGSWSLLGPGIATAFLASVLSTGTNPATWRAIMVIVIALVAILLGSQLKLAAPFFLGIIVLPIENIVVFAVQIGRDIQSVPWWITLAVVGAVLLIIAVTYERRSGEDGSIAARLRDLK